jgi:tetratricopeptide (TPR) repeat protein
MDKMVNLLFGMAHSTVEKPNIDGNEAQLISNPKGGYWVIYSPEVGYYAIIDISLSAMETTNFLKSLQIELESYKQGVIIQPGSGTSDLENSNLTAQQVEIENLYHYDQPGISLSDYWTEIGDALRDKGKASAANDAYGKALEFNPSNTRASMHKMEAAPGPGKIKLGAGGSLSPV